MSNTTLHTASVSRSAGPAFSADRLLGVIMVVVLACGFALAATALSGAPAHRRLADTANVAALLSGRTAAAVNYVAAHDLPGDPLVRAIGGVWRWRVFASGGPQVWVGRKNWLFYIDEMRPWPNADANMRTRADLVRTIAAALHKRHIDLLVALIPDKARIMSRMLDGRESAQAMARYDAIIALLRQREVATVNLDRTFAAAPPGSPLYYRTDTHWNQTGAALAARAIASAVTTPIDHTHHYRTVAEPGWSDGEGDLLRLMSLDRVPDDLPIRLRPPIDREHREQTTETDAANSLGLLDAPPPVDVALIGTSFSRNANFHGALQQALATVVGNFSDTGGGFAGAARSYFSGLAFREQPPKLVIWEIPERLLGQRLEDDDRALASVFSPGIIKTNPVEGD